MIKLSRREEDFLHLLREQALTGYLIKKAFSQVNNGAHKVSWANIYPTLLKLEFRGLISSYWEEKSELRSDRRRYYTITRAGEEALKEIQHYRQLLTEWRPN